MAVIEFGSELPSVYLDRFQPAENVPTRVALLDAKRVVAVEYHYLNLDHLDIKGPRQCIGGECCAAFGTKSQGYHLPILTYKNPSISAEGDVQDLVMSRRQYQDLVRLVGQYDVTAFDMIITRVKQGRGFQMNFSFAPAMPDGAISVRQRLTAEQSVDLGKAVELYYQTAETSIVPRMTAMDWQQIFITAGYDMINHQWAAQPQMAPGQAQQYISNVAQGVPQAQIPQAMGGYPPAMGAVPQAPAFVPQAQIPQANVPPVPQAAPVQNFVPPAPVQANIPPVQAAPVAPVAPVPQATPVAQSVPPVQANTPPVPQANIPPVQQTPPPSPGVPTKVLPVNQVIEADSVISTAELDSLLDTGV